MNNEKLRQRSNKVKVKVRQAFQVVSHFSLSYLEWGFQSSLPGWHTTHMHLHRLFSHFESHKLHGIKYSDYVVKFLTDYPLHVLHA